MAGTVATPSETWIGLDGTGTGARARAGASQPPARRGSFSTCSRARPSRRGSRSQPPARRGSFSTRALPCHAGPCHAVATPSETGIVLDISSIAVPAPHLPVATPSETGIVLDMTKARSTIPNDIASQPPARRGSFSTCRPKHWGPAQRQVATPSETGIVLDPRAEINAVMTERVATPSETGIVLDAPANRRIMARGSGRNPQRDGDRSRPPVAGCPDRRALVVATPSETGIVLDFHAIGCTGAYCTQSQPPARRGSFSTTRHEAGVAQGPQSQPPARRGSFSTVQRRHERTEPARRNPQRDGDRSRHDRGVPGVFARAGRNPQRDGDRSRQRARCRASQDRDRSQPPARRGSFSTGVARDAPAARAARRNPQRDGDRSRHVEMSAPGTRRQVATPSETGIVLDTRRVAADHVLVSQSQPPARRGSFSTGRGGTHLSVTGRKSQPSARRGSFSTGTGMATGPRPASRNPQRDGDRSRPPRPPERTSCLSGRNP